MGKVFGKCANCGSLIVGGEREGDLRFCSSACHRYHLHPGFCESCLSQTSIEPIGGTFTFNLLFGTRLMGFGSRCPKCYSIIKRKWLWLIIPVFPVSAKYRILYQTPRRYFSRKVKYDLA
jgi:hypothetical protein